ncbi:hypothetical protein A464_646 [Salmonella bongori N268-08]|uniref:Uncharacterized protein n=1 Tax=Salmonella bongori N268-08 TaxID=1197719 RepID=S5NBY3_SALBN|nr:hypothetical protein A464_646 [Salmonella bongori N268-08]
MLPTKANSEKIKMKKLCGETALTTVNRLFFAMRIINLFL